MRLDELEAIARAATPGPWHWNFDAKGYPGRVGKTAPCEPVEHCGYDSHCIALTYDGNERFDSRANAEYIAAFSPARVLAMLTVIRAAELSTLGKIWRWNPSEPPPSMNDYANSADYWKAMYEYRETEAQALSAEITRQHKRLGLIRTALAAFDELERK